MREPEGFLSSFQLYSYNICIVRSTDDMQQGHYVCCIMELLSYAIISIICVVHWLTLYIVDVD